MAWQPVHKLHCRTVHSILQPGTPHAPCFRRVFTAPCHWASAPVTGSVSPSRISRPIGCAAACSSGSFPPSMAYHHTYGSTHTGSSSSSSSNSSNNSNSNVDATMTRPLRPRKPKSSHSKVHSCTQLKPPTVIPLPSSGRTPAQTGTSSFSTVTTDDASLSMGGLNEPGSNHTCSTVPVPARTAVHAAKGTAHAGQPNSSTTSVYLSSRPGPSMQAQLVYQLQLDGTIQHMHVAEVMLAVDRGDFVPQNAAGIPGMLNRSAMYADSPVQLGSGQTISAPTMHAMCLELLADAIRQPGARALDVGAGSGYLTVCLALLAGPGSYVLGVERFLGLAAIARSNISKSHAQLLLPEGSSQAMSAAPTTNGPIPSSALPAASTSTMIRLVAGNVLAPGMLDEEGLFNAIHVGAAGEEVPQELLSVLAPGGRMVIPVGKRHGAQELQVVDKHADGSIDTCTVCGVRYVPLTRPEEDTQA